MAGARLILTNMACLGRDVTASLAPSTGKQGFLSLGVWEGRQQATGRGRRRFHLQSRKCLWRTVPGCQGFWRGFVVQGLASWALQQLL